MKSSAVILTRKIQLYIDHPDNAERKKILETLYRWQHMCFRSANYIFTHQFMIDQLGEFFYISDKIKLKLGNMHTDPGAVLTTSRQNTTYQLLAKYFGGELPSDIYSCLNRTAVTQYNREREAYWKGQKTIPNYQRNLPIPVKGRSLKQLCWTEDGRNLKFTLFKLPFRTCLGHFKDDKKELLQRIAAGSVHLSDSFIKLDKGKIFLLAVIRVNKENKPLQKNVVAEVSLSVECPLLVKIGTFSYRVGNREEFLYRRLAIQAAIKRAQATVGYNHSAHGKKRKFKSVTKYKGIEKNYVDYKLHVYSRRLIDLCIKHGAATILLLNQRENEQEAKRDEFLLRNWSLSGLKEKITYKAAKLGIEVVSE